MPTAMSQWIKWYNDLHRVTGTLARTWSTEIPLLELAANLRRMADEMEEAAANGR
jgi:hypothetical protein